MKSSKILISQNQKISETEIFSEGSQIYLALFPKQRPENQNLK